MIDALARELRGQVLVGAQAVELRRAGEGFAVRTKDGRTVSADAVVLAAPAYASAQLLAGLAPQLAGLLGHIRYVSTATISLGYRAGDAEDRLHGFGYVVPRQEGRKISACTWTSTKFDHRAPRDMALVRCFAGGPGHEEQVDLPDEELVRLARLEMAQLMGLQAEPVLARVFRWRRSNPQYDVGHLDRVREIHSLCAAQPGLFITGAAYEGVGVPDCVHQGQLAARRTLDYLRVT
jgi:oxygen-dependent protoporphyrinogen oxidase